MPFGWGANPNTVWLGKGIKEDNGSPMPFGWGANPNVSDAGVGEPQRGHRSPMPFGWGANPNWHAATITWERASVVTNAFRLGG